MSNLAASTRRLGNRRLWIKDERYFRFIVIGVMDELMDRSETGRAPDKMKTICLTTSGLAL